MMWPGWPAPCTEDSSTLGGVFLTVIDGFSRHNYSEPLHHSAPLHIANVPRHVWTLSVNFKQSLLRRPTSFHQSIPCTHGGISHCAIYTMAGGPRRGAPCHGTNVCKTE